MKLLLFSLFVAASAALLFLVVPTSGAYYPPSDCCCNSSHNFFFGRKSYYDRQIYRNDTYVSGKQYGKSSVLLQVASRQYPQPTIRYIEIIDHFADGLGGCARIVQGGVGYKYATISLSSSYNHPIASLVTAYGS